MYVFTYQSCWFRLWSKTVSWYDSPDLMHIHMATFSVFCFLFVVFVVFLFPCFAFLFCFVLFFVCCFCCIFVSLLCFFVLFCCFLFVYFFVFLCQSNCIANPCKNNATCQSGFTDKGYRCLCSAGFKGQICDEGNAIL